MNERDLPHALSQPVLDEVSPHIGEIEDDTQEIDHEGKPERSRVARMVNRHSAKEHTQTHADVPARQLRGIRRTSLVVRRQIDEHRLHAGPDVTVAQSDDDGCAIEAYGILQEGEQQVAEHADEDAMIDILHHPAPAQSPRTNQTRHDQARTQHRKPRTRTSRHAQFLLPVDGKIRSQHAIRQADAHHHHTLAPTLHEEEAVEGKGVFVGHDFLRREMHRRIDRQPQASSHQRDEEDDIVVANRIVDHQSHRRRHARRQIVRQPIIADALRPPRRGQHINRARAVRHSDRTHRRPMRRADHRKQRHRPRNQIARKQCEEQEIASQQHHLPRETVDQIPRHRTRQQCRERVARQHKPNRVLVCAVRLAQIQGQEGRHHHEREENHEVRRPNLHIIRIPKSILLHRQLKKELEKFQLLQLLYDLYIINVCASFVRTLPSSACEGTE